jgi:hypothetical protein
VNYVFVAAAARIIYTTATNHTRKFQKTDTQIPFQMDCHP